MTLWQTPAPRRRIASARGDAGTAIPWAWAVTGLIAGALGAVLVFAPARWLAGVLDRSTDGRLQLHLVRGSVWNGSAQLALGSGDTGTAATALPGRLSWTLRPGWRSASLRLSAPCCLAQPWGWTARWGLSGLEVQAEDLLPNAPARWPASILAGLGTPWNTLQLQGTLALSSRGLQAQWTRAGWTSTGSVQLDALQLSTRLSSLPEVGSYRLAWVNQPMAVPTLELSTLQGSLQLQGRGRWTGGRLQFRGEAQASAAQEAALANLLNIMGRRDGARSIITVG